jgi:hypothetical protein
LSATVRADGGATRTLVASDGAETRAALALVAEDARGARETTVKAVNEATTTVIETVNEAKAETIKEIKAFIRGSPEDGDTVEGLEQAKIDVNIRLKIAKKAETAKRKADKEAERVDKRQRTASSSTPAPKAKAKAKAEAKPKAKAKAKAEAKQSTTPDNSDQFAEGFKELLDANESSTAAGGAEAGEDDQDESSSEDTSKDLPTDIKECEEAQKDLLNIISDPNTSEVGRRDANRSYADKHLLLKYLQEQQVNATAVQGEAEPVLVQADAGCDDGSCKSSDDVDDLEFAQARKSECLVELEDSTISLEKRAQLNEEVADYDLVIDDLLCPTAGQAEAEQPPGQAEAEQPLGQADAEQRLAFANAEQRLAWERLGPILKKGSLAIVTPSRLE